MTKEYKHKGYTLQWSDGGMKDGMGGYYLFNPNGNPICHATTTSEPITEEQAIEVIEAHIELTETRPWLHGCELPDFAVRWEE